MFSVRAEVRKLDIRGTTRAGIALGSNLGDRLANLRAARERVLGLPAAAPPLLASAVYETEPIGCEIGAAPFLNAVVEMGFAREPTELLEMLRTIEQDLGRSPAHEKNTSRTIDLDLLYCGPERVETARLQLPHPRMHDRRFVLQPLTDIRPDLVLPGQSESVVELLRRLPTEQGLVRYARQW